MSAVLGNFTFRPLVPSDLPMFHEWVQRPHVAQWWSYPRTVEEVESEYLPVALGQSTTRAYIAMLNGQPIGFIQSYVVLGSGNGWWAQETDPGTRGIDQFLCNADQLSRGLGSAMVAAFTTLLLSDARVTKIQTDPSPENERAIRSYKRAGFEAVREVDTPDGRALLMIKTRTDEADQVAERSNNRLADSEDDRDVVFRDAVRVLLEVRMDALARKFHETHDMKVKDEIERLAREYGKLKEPWVFVAS